MTAYVIDTEKNVVTAKYDDVCMARYDMSENYSWEPNNRYQLLETEDEAYEYWEPIAYDSGIFYERKGISEETKYEIFHEWLNNFAIYIKGE